MTTAPDLFRRRQLIEGAVLIIVGLLMIFQTWYFHDRDMEQNACFRENFQELSVALSRRSALISKETEVTKKLWLTYAKTARDIRDNPTRELTPKENKEFRTELVDNLMKYERAIREIERARERNPLPPYPLGECSD